MALCVVSLHAGAQKDKWLLYSTEVDFDAGPSFSMYNFPAPGAGLETPYVVENAVFGEDGELYFFLQDGGVYNKNGLLLHTFSDTDGSLLKKEIGIAPAPGQCRTYCIFFLEATAFVGLHFNFFEMTVTGNGNPSYIGNTVTADIMSGNHGSLTVSQIVEGTVADRHIYVVSNAEGAVYRYLMTTTGLFYDGLVTAFPSDNDYESEVEVSPCNRHIAWSAGPAAYVYNMASSQLYTLNVGPGSFSGLEFAGDICQDLYLSHRRKGLIQWRFGEEGFTEFIPESEAFNITQLERGKDGFIYLVKNGLPAGALWRLDVVNNFLESVNAEINVFSNLYGGATDDVYALPDQIDGEGDDSFFGVPPLHITGLDINQFALPPQDFSEPPVFYNCGPIELNVAYEGAPSGYRINIVSVDPVDGQPVYGGQYLNYQADFPGTPSGPIDLRCLDDPILCSLFDNYEGQMFLVTVRIRDRCSVGQASGYFRVFGPPSTPADIDFRILAGDGPVYPAPATDINNPALSTVYGTIDLTNSNGDITFYQLQVWEVDCGNGQNIGALYDSGPKIITSVSELAFNLAALEINGITDYFGANQYDIDGRCIEVSVTIGNNCGTESAYTYIKFREIDPPQLVLLSPGMEAGRLQALAGEELSGIRAFPNPTSAAWSLAWPVSAPGLYTVRLFSPSGQLVERREVYLDKGEALLDFSLEGQPAGAYYFHIFSTAQSHFGKLIKI